MKKIFALMMLLILALNFPAYSEGIKNIKTECFYKTHVSYQVEDWTPSVSDQFYIGLSTDNGLTYNRITDTLNWGSVRPATKDLTFVPDTIMNNVILGLFINPNNIWTVSPVQTVSTNFIKAAGTFDNLPSEIYNGGKYNFVVYLYKEQLPEQMALQYSQNGTDWLIKSTFKPEFTTTFVLEENYLQPGNVSYRIVYVNTNEVIAQSNTVAVKQRDTYFRFKTYGGQKNLNDIAQIVWENSSNFASVNIKIFLNDSLISTDNYITDNLYLNFNNFGVYKIQGKVQSEGFVIEKTIVFTVGDPCELLKKENLLLGDTINSLRKRNFDLNIKLVDKDSLISNYKLTITKLNKFISDSTVFNLVYKSGDVVKVEDSKLSSNIQYITNTNNIVTLPKMTGQLTYWVFDVAGRLKTTCSYSDAIQTIDISDYAQGYYFLWILNNGSYTMYKFIK